MPNPITPASTLATIPSVVSPPLGFDVAKSKTFPALPVLLTPPSGHGLYNLLGVSGNVNQINLPGGNVTTGGGSGPIVDV